MKIIEINETTGNVSSILDCNDNIKLENLRLVDSIPTFFPEEGYSSGTLKYSEEEGLYWEPIKDTPIEEQYITSSELMSMIEEVL